MRLPRQLESAIEWLRDEAPRKRPRLPRGLDRRWLLGGLGLVASVGLAWALVAVVFDDEKPEIETRVVTVAVETDDASEAPVGPLGFPLVATRNTTRVGGPDPAADAAAVALATHPPAATAQPTEAAVLVAGDSPYAGIAASVLAGPPVRAPILIGASGEMPAPTTDALAKLQPRGGSGPADAAVYRIGDVAEPGQGLQSEQVGSGSPAEIASAVDQLRSRLIKTPPRHIVVASSEQAPYAMPAAAWAARSGDPVLFSGREEVPEATIEALKRHRGVAVYVLGPPSVISDQAMRRIERVSPGVQRIGAEGPAANSIAFARYANSSFGWNINDPGHGLVVASASRPLDAAAAASISASGKWGPLLVLERPAVLPAELRAFLLDIKPGFQDDPTRAVYNHIWLIGDTSAIGGGVQADLDELAELSQIGRGFGGPVSEPDGSGGPGFATPSGPTFEAEPTPQQEREQQRGGQGNP